MGAWGPARRTGVPKPSLVSSTYVSVYAVSRANGNVGTAGLQIEVVSAAAHRRPRGPVANRAVFSIMLLNMPLEQEGAVLRGELLAP